MTNQPSLDRLITLLQPPPPRTPPDWVAVEARLGRRLPIDYKRFVERFGIGQVVDFIVVLAPDSRASCDLTTQTAQRLDALRQLTHEVVPFDLTPGREGIIPWGITDNGDVMYWQATTDTVVADQIVVNAAREDTWVEFNGTMTKFLLEVITTGYDAGGIYPDQGIGELHLGLLCVNFGDSGCSGAAGS